MYPFHVPLTHLPIGLLLANALFSLLSVRRNDPTLDSAAFHCLWLGLIGVAGAVVTGMADAARQLFDPVAPRDDALVWINAHGLMGLVLIVYYWQIWQLRRRNPTILLDPETRNSYLTRLAFGVVLLVIDGWLGGHLVYTLRLGVSA
jgi:uncharacterized membrane protein